MQPQAPIPDSQEHLFADEDPINFYSEASQGQRFLNLLIDGLFIRLALSGVIAELVVNFLAEHWTGPFIRIVEDKGFEYYLMLYLIGSIGYILYYGLSEGLLRGRTLGKLITGTRAIRTDGQDLSFKEVMLRTIIRLVPLEPFSGFTTPWHDSWSRTMVIRTR